MAAAAGAPAAPLVLMSERAGVRTLQFNVAAKLNGWSPALLKELKAALDAAATDAAVRAVVLTGSGRYYSAGVDFAGSLAPMSPSRLLREIEASNRALFEQFILFPKPLVACLNGPAIGASVTSATLCDAIVCSETASFLTPFKTLGLVPEGCSSYKFPQLLGAPLAKQVLEGRKIEAREAVKLGFADQVVPAGSELAAAQRLAEEWVVSGRPRKSHEVPGEVDKLLKVNADESRALANAITAEPFLAHMANFSYQKGKWVAYFVFTLAKLLLPLWQPSRL